MALKHIALNRLQISLDNARSDETDIASLAVSIRSVGLLQNLVVTPPADTTAGLYAVIAGARRYRALSLLVEQGHLPDDAPIPCNVFTAIEIALDASLAENLHRVQMTPVQEFKVFAALADQGKTADEIAERFGIGLRDVQGRMKLGRLSPKLLELLEQKKIGLDEAKAFCLVDDHGQQERAYEALSKAYYMSPSAIRNHLSGGAVAACSSLGKFIASEYIAAGLPVRADLFSETDGTYFEDRAAASDLAVAKLNTEADRLRADGWSWVVPALQYSYDIIANYRRVEAEGRREPTEAEKAELSRLEEERDRILAKYEPTGAEEEEADDGDVEGIDEDGEVEGAYYETAGDEDIDLEDADQAEVHRLNADIAALERRLSGFFTDEQKAGLGCFLFVANNGGFDVRTGYLAPSAAAAQEADASLAGYTEAKPKEKGPYSMALVADLEAHRTQALQATLAGRPDYALSLMLFNMYSTVDYSGYMPSPSSIRATAVTPSSSAVDMRKSPASTALATIRTRVTAKITGQSDRLALFDAIHSLSPEEKNELLAYLVALTVTAPLAEHGNTPDPIVERIGGDIGVQVADWWRPTGSEFFGRVSKGTILDIPCLGSGAKVLATMKKAPMVEALDRWFGAPGEIPATDFGIANENGPVTTISADAAQTISEWLPSGMGFAQEATLPASAPEAEEQEVQPLAAVG